ncbi:MAG: GGDEF domain-containing protein [Epsilonproteobacteria bacterium]|nr:GGDEF domain-containing protein [Campylobacterota bacterium]
MRSIVRKLGHIQVVFLITLSAILASEVLAYIIPQIFSFPYPMPSTPIVTFIVTAILTPFLSWHLLKLFFFIDELEQEMNYLATYDSMTELFSRQAFFKHSLALHENAKLTNDTYCVCIIDIDNFKYINDTYGHSGGDKVLIHFGTLLRKLYDSSYIVGRIGGEEFSIVSSLDITTKHNEIQKIHDTLATATCTYKNTKIAYTVSIGIFENTMPESITFDEALSHADNALYEAKTTGKNKSIVFNNSNLNTKVPQEATHLRTRKLE